MLNCDWHLTDVTSNTATEKCVYTQKIAINSTSSASLLCRMFGAVLQSVQTNRDLVRMFRLDKRSVKKRMIRDFSYSDNCESGFLRLRGWVITFHFLQSRGRDVAILGNAFVYLATLLYLLC